VGLVLGLEMSRLARSCKDWHQLLELCARFRVLLADADGVYDPTEYADRLMLGLTGMMSEAELHVLKGRMHQGKLNKARRGELVVAVPVGYLKHASGEVTLDPDEQVRAVVRLRVCSCYLGGKFAPARGRLNGGRKSTHPFRRWSFAMPARRDAAATTESRQERIEAILKELRPKIEATVRRMVERAVDVPEAEEFGAIDFEFRDAGQELANEVRQAGVASRKKRGT